MTADHVKSSKVPVSQAEPHNAVLCGWVDRTMVLTMQARPGLAPEDYLLSAYFTGIMHIAHEIACRLDALGKPADEVSIMLADRAAEIAGRMLSTGDKALAAKAGIALAQASGRGLALGLDTFETDGQ